MARTYKYQKIKNAIAKMGVEELVSEFNALVGKRYWCAARYLFCTKSGAESG